MLQLPNVTLICVATENVPEALHALMESQVNPIASIRFAKVVLLTDEGANAPEYEELLMWNIHRIKIGKFESVMDWNKFIFYNLGDYVDTEFCLLIHPDGYVIRPDLWQDEFLNYDYIGAPWFAGKQFDIHGNEVRVGNSVSIRSKKLLDLPKKLDIEWIPENEDTAICATYRHLFEAEGITYAPLELACHFSKENAIPEQKDMETFCFHKWRELQFTPDNLYASYINLDSRPDRNEKMIAELQRVDIPAVRTRGILPEEVDQPDHKLFVMQNRTPGAIGCHYSQVAVMEEALRQGKHALVMEDDLIFCDDIQERFTHIGKFLTDHDWDIMWLGGTYHNEPTWHKSINEQHTHPDLQMCKCELNRDWEPTDDPLIVRTYGCWSTYAYIVNKNRIAHILDSLDQNVYRSMGIDWLFILLQPNLNTFAFNPGCVRQYNNQSNIGNGVTDFDGFHTLGNHWFKSTL